MTNASFRTLVVSLVLVVVMVVVEGGSWRDWYDDDDIEIPTYVWNRAARSRPRVRCVHTAHRCDSTNPCCKKSDVCLTSPQTDSDGLRIAKCVAWTESLALNPRLPNGVTCTDSWECSDRCCREYRAHRHDVILECGKPFDGLEWHTCVSGNA